MSGFRRFILALLLAPGLASAEVLPQSTPQGEGYAVLIVSRERLEIGTPCEIGLYLHDQLAARLYQGQSAAFNLPPGDVDLRLGIIGTYACQPRVTHLKATHLNLAEGEVRRYRIALDETGLHLIPAPGPQ